MSSKSANFGDKKIKKSDFYKNKKVAKIDDFDVNKTLVFKEEPYWTKNSFKYFIGYNDNDIIRPLCIKLSQMTGYVRTFESNTTMVMVLCVQIFKVKPCKCLPIIMLDSVMKANKKYYPQILLEGSKYALEKIKMGNLIDDDLGKSESEESESDSNDGTESDED